MPDEMVSNIVQYRFRVEKEQWPLLQLGPGIATLNYTEKYSWKDFEKRSNQLINWLFDSYPNAPENLQIVRLQLKYIDAIPINFETENILDFMSKYLGINIKYPDNIFTKLHVSTQPRSVHHVANFKTSTPAGILQLLFSRGKSQKEDALIWETTVGSMKKDIPQIPKGFPKWLSEAHDITHNLFIAMIKGPLYEKFK